MPPLRNASQTVDYVVIGSGFGGSISTMRLAKKGYEVILLERGKRFRDEDFPNSNWRVWKYLWAPALRCFGILQISFFRNVLVLHGSGVGGGSLGYANVLMEPSDEMFRNPQWSHLADWKPILRPHYDMAKKMLGVTSNPRLSPADQTLRQIAAEMGQEATFRPTTGGVYYGEPGEDAPDPYFGGEGPSRTGCIHCGGCMIGCRHNAKNTLPKNYLYFAEKWGAKIWAETEVSDVRPLPPNQADEARYEVIYRSSTNPLSLRRGRIRARNVIVSAGALGTMRLLFRCRDVTQSLPRLSRRLGEMVRTNSEALLGSTNRTLNTDWSKGIAITSIFNADAVTTIEPVRYPNGSSLMRFLSGPLIKPGTSIPMRIARSIFEIITHPMDFMKVHLLPGWAKRSTILLVMQTEDNRLKMRLGRGLFTGYRRNLLSAPDGEYTPPTAVEIGHKVTRAFAQKTNAVPLGSINEGLFNIPLTAHILGGVPFGKDENEGVIDLKCEVFNYPGLFVIDGSIMPANPGVNPSLTIAALSEYAMSQVPVKPGKTEIPAAFDAPYQAVIPLEAAPKS